MKIDPTAAVYVDVKLTSIRIEYITSKTAKPSKMIILQQTLAKCIDDALVMSQVMTFDALLSAVITDMNIICIFNGAVSIMCKPCKRYYSYSRRARLSVGYPLKCTKTEKGRIA